MQIGAQLFTVREFTQTPEGIADTFKKIADIGYKTVQVSAIGAIEPEKLDDIAKSNDLSIIVTHTNPDRILSDTQNVIKEHKLFHCSHVGIGSMPQKYKTPGIEGYRQFIADYNEAAKALNAEGLKLHYHNHGFEFEHLDGFVPYDVMLAETDPELWGFILDTFWIQFAGRTPAVQIEAMAGRIDVCHFKDMQIVGNDQLMAPVLEGNLDFKAIFAACKKTNVKHAMVEQDNCNGENPFDMLKLSFDNLMKAL